MPCIPFNKLESGKVRILDGELNLLRLKEDKHYLVDDSLLDAISSKMPYNSVFENNSLSYIVIGWTADKSQGIAGKVNGSEFKDAFEEILSYETFLVNPKV